ncbi:MAG: hypothetical protein RL168_849 [Bacteroidota bacterium]|jgi:shikimate kinase
MIFRIFLSMQKRLFLLGYMGVGKSTWAKKLGKALELPVHDLDQILESQLGMSISAYILHHGELSFRKQEKQAVLDCKALEGVIAVGGGTPCYYDNMQQLNALGHTVYLHAPVGFLAKRLQDSFLAGTQRPLLAGVSLEDYAEFIGKHLMERQAFYSQSQSRIAVDKEEVLARLIDCYQTR